MTTDPLSDIFAALADPTRRAIVARLAEGEATVNTLAEPFQMSLPSVSKHISVLERAGLVAKRTDRQQRFCRLEPDALREVRDWADVYRDFWEGSFMKLGQHLDERKDNDRPERG